MSQAPNRVNKLGPALAGALALLGAAVIVGAGHSWIMPVTLRPDWSKNSAARVPSSLSPGRVAEPDTAQVEPADEGHYIDLIAAKRLLDEEGALFLDARPQAEFERARVVGAMHLTAEMISSGRARSVIADLVESYGYDYPIVIYCHGGDCDASDNVAKLLLPMGFANLRVMKAGFEDWQSAGYEVE